MFPGLDDATAERVNRTFSAMGARGITPVYVPTRHDALTKLLDLMPKGSAVAHGSSTTLEQIGFVQHLSDPMSDRKSVV